MNRSTLLFGATALVVTATSADAVPGGFSGGYAPGTWTVTGGGIGGASAVFAADGSSLTITGGDGGVASTISVTHPALSSGTWSFEYTWNNFNGTPGFDVGYYLHNGVKFDISLGGVIGTPGTSGTISFPVTAGDIVGWQVVTVDGIFGPGQLVIHPGPPPAPGSLALLGVAGLARSRRRA